jgi:hypothetical protein
VEFAIVLAIMALIVGGIFKGREMVTNAKIRSAEADFTGVAAAYYAYLDRYHAIPGDDPNAATRWPGATSGNGDGVVSGAYNSTTATDESRLFWDHLRRAGFIAGSGSAQPLTTFPGMIGVQTGSNGGTPSTALGGFAGLIVCSTNVPDKLAIAVDRQMDDGLIDQGSIRGQLQIGSNPNIDTTADNVPYAETGTNLYTLCSAL